MGATDAAHDAQAGKAGLQAIEAKIIVALGLGPECGKSESLRLLGGIEFDSVHRLSLVVLDMG
ncbi:hypothetical protein CF135_06210 [Aeromonas veronii]|nr:hypothetical protein CF135_06210 [Aeromonas veronii]